MGKFSKALKWFFSPKRNREGGGREGSLRLKEGYYWPPSPPKCVFLAQESSWGPSDLQLAGCWGLGEHVLDQAKGLHLSWPAAKKVVSWDFNSSNKLNNLPHRRWGLQLCSGHLLCFSLCFALSIRHWSRLGHSLAFPPRSARELGVRQLSSHLWAVVNKEEQLHELAGKQKAWEKQRLHLQVNSLSTFPATSPVPPSVFPAPWKDFAQNACRRPGDLLQFHLIVLTGRVTFEVSNMWKSLHSQDSWNFHFFLKFFKG